MSGASSEVLVGPHALTPPAYQALELWIAPHRYDIPEILNLMSRFTAPCTCNFCVTSPSSPFGHTLPEGTPLHLGVGWIGRDQFRRWQARFGQLRACC